MVPVGRGRENGFRGGRENGRWRRENGRHVNPGPGGGKDGGSVTGRETMIRGESRPGGRERIGEGRQGMAAGRGPPFRPGGGRRELHKRRKRARWKVGGGRGGRGHA